MSIHAILTALAATSSRNEKEAILKQNVDNTLLKNIISHALNPFENFWIRKIPGYVSGNFPTYVLESALDELMLIGTRKVTGHAALKHLQNILEHLTPEDANVIERVVLKDLRCGVSESTVNKIWPGLIAEYPCMKAEQFSLKLLGKIAWPAIGQLKMDGMRFNAIVKNGKVEYFSRNGKPLDIYGVLDEEFIAMAGRIKDTDVVFDGELWVADPFGDPLPRKTGNGILSKSIKDTLSEKEAEGIRATVWDMIPHDKFVKGRYDLPYAERFSSLKLLIQKCAPQKINLVEFRFVANVEDAQGYFQEALGAGQEGIIVKDPAGPWEDKRAKHQVKFKAEKECELRVTGWLEGTGKYSGILGALQCETEDGVLKVDVGSGFSDQQRKTFTKGSIVGKIITVQYNEKIKDKKSGQDSLFLPVFNSVRDDRNEANLFKELT